MFANIGAQYGKAHIGAIELLDFLPNAHTFVGGGYARLSEGDPNGFYFLGARESLELLTKRGFNTNYREFLEKSGGFTEKLTFIVERDN